MPARKLAKYRAKRDFAKTTEPSGDALQASPGHAYLIQKHAATRLHYDFRLELNGTLKSWAVTEGPSLNPVDKRLAVHVEDHPLAYGDFEGTIPKGEYGGGTVMLWDHGSWSPIGDAERGYKKGKLDFELHGERLKGRWHLVRMHGNRRGDEKRENWLLIKGKDQYADEDGDAALEKYQTSVVSDRNMESLATGKSKVWKSKGAKEAPSPNRPKPRQSCCRSDPKRRPALSLLPNLSHRSSQPSCRSRRRGPTGFTKLNLTATGWKRASTTPKSTLSRVTPMTGQIGSKTSRRHWPRSHAKTQSWTAKPCT